MRMLAVLLLALSSAARAAAPDGAAIDAEVRRAMTATGAKGLAIAVIEDGRVRHVAAHGVRNAAGDPLRTDTIMYGASLTKAAFAHMVVQLAEQGVIDLDRSIAELLPRPLPDYPTERKYAPWSGLADDARWRSITPRMLLGHRAGFANFAFLEPDGRLRIHFDPGTRYAYSGEGMILLQFVLERGLGLDVGEEMQRRVFGPFGMARTSMQWRPDFAGNVADGWDADGKPQPHDERSRVRAAGSMDTTIADMARFAAAYVRGQGLGRKAAAARLAPQVAIDTASQFPTPQAPLPLDRRRRDLAAGLGVVVFDGPQGPAFEKTGHDDITGNIMLCVQRGRRCVVLMANDVRAETAFPALARFVLGETGAPWTWEYGDRAFWPGGASASPGASARAPD